VWWDNDYIQNDNSKEFFITNHTKNTFLKPFSATIAINWWDIPKLGSDQNYTITIMNEWWISSISNGLLDISKESLIFSTNHSFDTLNVSNKSFSISNPTGTFNGTYNANNDASVLQESILSVDNMNVSYILWADFIKYPLNNFWLSSCSVTTLWLKTIWITQLEGKWEISWGSENFSNLSTSELRNSIRKNAFTLVRALNSGQIVNNIRYIEWDISLWWEISWYETLIVKNWNVFISSDLNTSDAPFGIIVIKDSWYFLESDYNTSWNIYVGKNVTQINASIYADWAFRSATIDGVSYNEADLWIKLILQGVLFSKNTVGWALSTGWDLLLPGGEITSNIALAKIYDLNYVRRVQICGDDYSFLIEYNPKIQTNPPVWFSF
jgi:hypothetical protein